jgi:hypothetical protein
MHQHRGSARPEQSCTDRPEEACHSEGTGINCESCNEYPEWLCSLAEEVESVPWRHETEARDRRLRITKNVSLLRTDYFTVQIVMPGMWQLAAVSNLEQ